MATIKLTKGIREEIVDLMIKRKFGPIKKKIDDKKEKLADKFYNMIYTKAEQEKMYALPKGWLVENSSMDFRIPCGPWKSFYFPKDEKGNKTFKRVHSDKSCTINLDRSIPKEAKIIEMIEAFEDEQQTYKKERREAERQAMALLSSVTTVKRAIEVWPEAEYFIKKAIGAHASSNAPVPVILTENLNNKLGLPPKKEEQR